MRDLFDTFFVEPFKESTLIGFILGILMWLLGIALALFIFGGIFMFFDSCGQQVFEKEGIVTNKIYHEGYQTTTYYKYGDVNIPQTVDHPPTFSIVVEIDGQKGSINVYDYFYHNTGKGDKVVCKFQKGRYSDAIYIDEIYKK